LSDFFPKLGVGGSHTSAPSHQNFTIVRGLSNVSWSPPKSS